MVTIYLPRIKAENYQVFRMILVTSDLPESFEQWERALLDKKAQYLLQWQPDCIVTNVEINPGELSDYCRATGANSTMESLFMLATEKGTGQRN